MADRAWISRIVNTKGRPCPLAKRRCPGHEAGCAFWVRETLTDAATRGTDTQDGCLLAWQYVMGHEVVVECVRTQAGLDKTATVLREAGTDVRMALERTLTPRGALTS